MTYDDLVVRATREAKAFFEGWALLTQEAVSAGLDPELVTDVQNTLTARHAQAMRVTLQDITHRKVVQPALSPEEIAACLQS